MHIWLAAEDFELSKLDAWRGGCEFNTLERFTM
jgi:hypothetical protein